MTSAPDGPRDPSRPHGAGDPGDVARTDPPPYAWLDDPAQPFGPVGIGTSLVLGGLLGGLGLFGVVMGIVGGPEARVARLVVGLVLVLLAAVIARMAVARRAWRRRHPGLDPFVTALESAANVGSPLGDDSAVGRIGRWVLVAVCAFLVVVAVLSLQRAASGQTPTGVGGIVVIVLLGLLALGVGVLTLTRSRRPRR